MYTQALPSCAPRAVYLNDGQAPANDTRNTNAGVDTTGYLLGLARKILEGDNVGQATESTFEQVCKDGIKERLRQNKGKILLGVGLVIAASATAGYQIKKHEVFA